MRRIVPIVEGHSEAHAIPAFIRRILGEMGARGFESDRAIRENRQRLVKPDLFVNRLRMAQGREYCAGILLLLDADDDATCIIGPRLLKTARDQGVETPCRVVVAVREIEAWLIAGIESLGGVRGVPEDLGPPENVESIRGAKEWLDRRMRTGYKPTIDLLPLLMKLDYEFARRGAPSLDKFLRDLMALVEDSV